MLGISVGRKTFSIILQTFRKIDKHLSDKKALGFGKSRNRGGILMGIGLQTYEIIRFIKPGEEH